MTTGLLELGWEICDTCGCVFDPEQCEGCTREGFSAVHGDHPAWCGPCNDADGAYGKTCKPAEHVSHSFPDRIPTVRGVLG